jgi:hypothetical protein
MRSEFREEILRAKCGIAILKNSVFTEFLINQCFVVLLVKQNYCRTIAFSLITKVILTLLKKIKFFTDSLLYIGSTVEAADAKEDGVAKNGEL